MEGSGDSSLLTTAPTAVMLIVLYSKSHDMSSAN